MGEHPSFPLTAAFSQTERELQEDVMPFPIERYLNVRSAMGGTFRPDGRRLAFLTDITGTYQVFFSRWSRARHQGLAAGRL